jgi:hypothetical protein
MRLTFDAGRARRTEPMRIRTHPPSRASRKPVRTRVCGLCVAHRPGEARRDRRCCGKGQTRLCSRYARRSTAIPHPPIATRYAGFAARPIVRAYASVEVIARAATPVHSGAKRIRPSSCSSTIRDGSITLPSRLLRHSSVSSLQLKSKSSSELARVGVLLCSARARTCSLRLLVPHGGDRGNRPE